MEFLQKVEQCGRRSHKHFHSKSLCCLTRCEVCFWFVGLCCVSVAIPATCALPSFCAVVAAVAFEVSGREMGGDSFQTHKSKSCILGKDRAEKVLADAITIDGRNEWICKFCSETNVWTRWRCRRCYSNIPTGLREKCRQAISAKTGRWSTESSPSRWRIKEVPRSGCGD